MNASSNCKYLSSYDNGQTHQFLEQELDGFVKGAGCSQRIESTFAEFWIISWSKLIQSKAFSESHALKEIFSSANNFKSNILVLSIPCSLSNVHKY